MAKIAISLPDEVFYAVEKERLACGMSRSEFFRRAAQEHIRREQEREAIEQYTRGYQRYPETEDENWLYAAGVEALAADPWDEEENH